MMVNAKHKQASDIIRRGTYRKSYFKYSSKFYKDITLKGVLSVYTSCFNKFKKNKTYYKIKLIDSILNRFKIDHIYIENLMKKFNKILSEAAAESINPNLKSNIKQIPMVLVNHKKIGASLVIEFCLSHYKMTYMNCTNDEKVIKNIRYSKLDFEMESSELDISQRIIRHLSSSIIDFMKNLNLKTVKVLPIILIKSEENLRRSGSIILENLNTPQTENTSLEVSIQQIIENLIDNDEKFLSCLQTSLDDLTNCKNEHTEEKSESDESKIVDESNSIIRSKLLVCATIGVTMASFLANYFYDERCVLLINLSPELNFCYYNANVEKLICITFSKLLESGKERKTSTDTNNTISIVNSILTNYDFELDSFNDGKQKYFNNMIGILNQCELVRLILVDMMMYGVIFEKDYKVKNSIVECSEVKDAAELYRPILTEKIIKRHNPNIKLHMKYSLHAKLFSDIENDVTCSLNKVKNVLKGLGLKQTSYYDRLVTKSICQSITKRSAQILAGLIATVFKHLNYVEMKTEVCIGLEGLIFKSRPIFNAYLEFYLNYYMKSDIKYYLKISRVEYSLGAAYALMLVLDMKLKEGIIKSYQDTINNLTVNKSNISMFSANSHESIFQSFLSIFKY